MKAQNRFNNFVVTSIVVHGCLLALVLLAPKIDFSKKSTVEIVIIEEPIKQLPQTITEDLAKRIVETDEKSANELLNEKAKYLSAKNNTVTKETIAKLDTKFKNTQTENSGQQKIAQKARSKSNPDSLKEFAKQKNESGPSLFGDKFNAYTALEKNNAKLGVASTATDRIEGVDQSLKTALNTREYKYYGYYQRIKTQLNQWWQPEVKEKVSRLMSKGRTLASVAQEDLKQGNKVTKLIIVLNDVGTLVKVQVIGESGVRDLDEAAVEAFRQAAPFPNPPKGMIESDGTIKIRWDFVVES